MKIQNYVGEQPEKLDRRRCIEAQIDLHEAENNVAWYILNL